jgi:mRNA interferase MazF
VLTPANYNRRAGVLIACPITNREKGYPFEVKLPRGLPVTGVILVDHLKSLDFRARNARVVGKCPAEVLDEVQGKLFALLGFDD